MVTLLTPASEVGVRFPALPQVGKMAVAAMVGSLQYIYSFIWGFMSLSTLYRSYHDG